MINHCYDSHLKFIRSSLQHHLITCYIAGCDVCGENHSTDQCPDLGLNAAPIQLDQLSTRY